MPHPSTSSAYGIWKLNEVRDAVRGDNWPTEVPIFWTIPDISSATYDSVAVNTTTNGFGNPNSIRFSSDGLNFYISDSTLDNIGQYTMTTAFDISTASYTASYDPAEVTATPQLVGLSTDGTKMYIMDSSGIIYQYTLSTAWDVTSSSYDSVSYNIETAYSETNTLGAVFSSNGTEIIGIGTVSGNVFTHTLSTAWDLSTASSASQSFSIASQETTPNGVAFNPEGTQMFIVGSANDAVYQYTLSTAYNVTSASYDSTSFSVATQETVPTGLTFNANGTKMYIVGSIVDNVHQYSTGL